jgi:hypothetical protein
VSLPGLASNDRAKGHDDQCIASQHGQSFAKLAVDRRLTPPHRSVVKTGQVVVDQGSTVHQLQRTGILLRQVWVIIATRQAHGQRKLGADSCAAWHHGMDQGLTKPRGSLWMSRFLQAGSEHALYSFDQHGSSSCQLQLTLVNVY